MQNPFAQDIYREAFNHAFIEYKDPSKRKDDSSQEEVSHKVAWAAVKHKYYKDEDSGEWRMEGEIIFKSYPSPS